ncbi:MAG: hypothetical protein JW922_10295 [Paludibacteraceae bacterium]|nr:hypothetical protein [Paludibacteraceae bacterium]
MEHYQVDEASEKDLLLSLQNHRRIEPICSRLDGPLSRIGNFSRGAYCR